ncbi:hypothetical protein BMH30_12690 [Leucobacter sp. OLES1]|nr:hypothetical protein BMH30_12690 [Leucobacter sp. OLES1]
MSLDTSDTTTRTAPFPEFRFWRSSRGDAFTVGVLGGLYAHAVTAVEACEDPTALTACAVNWCFWPLLSPSAVHW